jgi:glycosyltransferase involved in cell wall biosynthesis
LFEIDCQMKITFLNSSDTTGGAAIACRRISEALKKEGVESSMLVQEKLSELDYVTNLCPTGFQKKLALLRFAREKFYFLFLEKSAGIRFSFSLANTGIDVTRKYNFSDTDIIHLHWINQGFLSLKGLKKIFSLGKPVIWTLHDMWAFTGGCHHSRGCMKYLEECCFCPYLSKPHSTDISNKIWNEKKRIFADADLSLITPSRWLAGRVRESALLGSKNIYDIPNPLNIKVFKPTDKIAARKRLGLPENKTFVGFVALNTSNYFKGGTYLIEALHKISKEHPELKDKIAVLLLGKSNQTSLEKIPFRVFSPGYITNEEKLIDFYNSLDAFILPSLEENLPNTIIEAMSCGVPPVSFNVGGVPEIIDHKQNGYLAEYKSVEDLASGIVWVLKNRDSDLIENARKKVVENYDYPVVAKRYLKIYQSITYKNSQSII